VAAIRCPVLAIQSTHTRPDGTRVVLTTPRSGWLDFLRDRIAGLTVALIPDSGYFSMLEQPDLVTQALTRFVRTLGHRAYGPAAKGHAGEKPSSSL
jgi:pimeloyl-ACP methyl ester carboxylesterase